MRYSFYLNACSLLVVPQALLPARKQDVLDTVLFSQLAADEDFPGGLNDSQWFEVFTNTLSACGWTFYAKEDTDEVFSRSFDATFSVRRVLAESVNRNFPEHQVAAVSAVMNKVATLSPDSDAAQVFREHCLLGGGAETTRVRVMTGIVEEDGFLNMTSVSFATRGAIGEHVFEKEVGLNKVDGAVRRRFYRARFNQDHFNEYREDTVQWLGGLRGTQCIEIEPSLSIGESEGRGL
ncbi:hypothetical protein LOY38_26425 [Pseudomonas sp. B21-015]|uniref:hypothetical protein n=1 Tax=Pseudomonas sp. B21-015 TaxID=2895473 RepID=UPI0021602250|nr:hypothetical protein [Pseudomonas sp. B21-015]UVM49834.1 hypothetical protein LOY38_26425 [Pseudomonas sp. B21-015]